MELEEEPRRANLLPCAECGCEFAPALTRTRICPTCISRKNDITAGLPKELLVQWCRYCARYYGPPWTLCQKESKELLGLCLKKVRGLNRLKLLDAAFLYTEPHSKRLRVRLTVQKEVVAEISLQQSFEVEFTEVYTQCDDCKKDFTPHTWMACVQLRQRGDNRKTLLYLEQLMLKNEVHAKAIKISQERFGLNFFFAKRAAASRLVEFVCGALPTALKESRELISHDIQNANYNYKFTTFIELPRICRDDLVVLPAKLCKEFGGLNAVAVCYRVGSTIGLFDPLTLKKVEMSAQQYFSFEKEFRVLAFRGNETEFYVADIALEGPPKLGPDSTFADISRRFSRAEVVRVSDHAVLSCTTHLGHILKHGDSVLGYDLTAINFDELEGLRNQRYLPDVVLVRKIYPERRKRFWRLKRMEIEEEDGGHARRDDLEKKDFEEFMEELEQDKYLRAKVNLYVAPDAEPSPAVEQQHTEMVQLGELLSDMTVTEKPGHDEAKMQSFIEDFQSIDFKRKQN